MSWEKVKLGDIALCIQPGPFGSQLHSSDYADEGTPIIMPKDMVEGKISHHDLIRVPDEHLQRVKRHQVFDGDLMVARKGDVRKCVYITENENGWLTGSDCLKVSLDKDRCYPKFVYYQLRSPFIGKWLETISIGSTMPSLNTGLLSGIEIALPSMSAQIRIAEILSAYDDLIENNQKQIKLLEEAAQRLYKEWFVDLRFPGHENTPIVDGVPEGWQKCTLNEICTVKKDTVTSKQIAPDTPYIGLEHMPRIDFCLSDWGKANDVTSNKFRYSEDDIIFGKIRPYFHKVGFALNCGVVSTDSFVMVAKSGLWGLLLMTVFDKAFVEYTYQTCKEGSKMPRADWKQMEKYPVLIPNQDILNQFEQYAWTITRKIKMLALQNHALTEARDRLLPKLMNGEIEV